MNSFLGQNSFRIAQGHPGPATRYVHPTNVKSVVDNKIGEIFHVGREGFKY